MTTPQERPGESNTDLLAKLFDLRTFMGALFLIFGVIVTIVALTASEADIILGVLTLVDLTLTGSLIVIVIFSGYENFVSRIDAEEHKDWPEWMGKIDFTGLKLKLMSSIVAISAVQLLKSFMNVGKVSDRDLAWYVGIHLVFVVSGLLLAWTDRVSGEAHHHVTKGDAS